MSPKRSIVRVDGASFASETRESVPHCNRWCIRKNSPKVRRAKQQRDCVPEQHPSADEL
jgi:hypothetical protein